MPKSRLYLFPAIGLFAILGCQANQLHRTESNFRDAMTDMYTEQAMDNLIRAREGQPFLQLAYSGALIQSTDMYSAGFSPSFGGSDGTARGATGLVTSTTSMLTRAFGFSSGASRAKLVSFHAEPVTNQNDVYETYLSFASDPSLLMVSDQKPNCAVICQKKCGHKYYYVPNEAGRAFQDLVLKTALMRGPETAPPAGYEVQVTRVVFKPSEKNQGTVIAQIYLSANVPNGLGFLIVKIDGRTVKLPVMPTSEPIGPGGKMLDDGALTTQIESQWNPKTRGIDPSDLVQKSVKIYSNLYPPGVAAVSQYPQQVLNALDSIRANVSPGGLPR